MTFIPDSFSDRQRVPFSASAILQRASATKRRPSVGEDDARKALGTDQRFPGVIMAGPSLEHLARIALG